MKLSYGFILQETIFGRNIAFLYTYIRDVIHKLQD